MHSAVMQNKKYISFAEENSVEVLALSRLDEGIQKKDKRAVAYKAKGPDGQDVTYMLEWPGLTLAEILTLDRSKAAQYNKTGKIPYTCLVDPHTEAEVERLGSSAKAIMESVEAYRKKLQKEHGKGYSRKDLEKLTVAEAKVGQFVAAKEFAKAVEALGKVVAQGAPEPVTKRLTASREAITKAATDEVQRVEELSKTDVAKAKKELAGLVERLRGTGVEDKAKDLMKALAASSSN